MSETTPGPRITRLTLTDFRSYETLDVRLSGKPVVLIGANGAGKTNLLEALSLLGSGRGLRHAKMADVTRQQGGNTWTVAITLQEEGSETRLGISGGAERRLVRIDGTPASGAGALLDYIRFLWLSPAQDRLFMEGASDRRRFLDRMTLAHDPAHGKRVAVYEQAMRQRQRVLEQFPRCDLTLLSVLEQQMAEAGIAIAAARRDMAAKLASGAQALSSGAFPIADVVLEGGIEEALATMVAADVEDQFARDLSAQRPRDAQAGRALLGPHRSDLIVRHREKRQLARLCSTGEQKALLIGLVLANAQVLAQDASGVPLILLLDEVAAHLDQQRRAALYDILDTIGFQAFLTGTDAALFEDFSDRAEWFEVAENSLRPLSG